MGGEQPGSSCQWVDHILTCQLEQLQGQAASHADQQRVLAAVDGDDTAAVDVDTGQERAELAHDTAEEQLQQV